MELSPLELFCRYKNNNVNRSLIPEVCVSWKIYLDTLSYLIYLHINIFDVV